jgi:hypothetical protein
MGNVNMTKKIVQSVKVALVHNVEPGNLYYTIEIVEPKSQRRILTSLRGIGMGQAIMNRIKSGIEESIWKWNRNE